MSLYKCLVVDDEELARELIISHLQQFPDFELVASCASAIEASQVLQQQSIDLIFLDIEMPVFKGTDFYKSLLNKPKVIFTTAYRDYAVEGFDLDAVDYLLKPIFFARFFNAIERFLAFQKNHLPEINTVVNENQKPAVPVDHIYVRKDRKNVKVLFDDILYISGLKDYVEMHLLNKTHVIKFSMGALEDKLPAQFVRIHRSYIVNLEKITAYTNHDVEIGHIEIPIGENYKKNLCMNGD